MKIKILLIIFLLTFLLCGVQSLAQVTYLDQDPLANAPVGFLGWDDSNNHPLDIKQNNDNRMRFHATNWPGYNAQASINDMNRIIVPMSNNFPVNFTSMMHIGSPLAASTYRAWMNVGTTYAHEKDVLYVGLMPSPGTSDNATINDAILAWGNNDEFYSPQNGPDNFRFLFVTNTNATQSPASAIEGLETMRITPVGNVGIGDYSTNLSGLAEQPTHRLDVNGTARLRLMPNDTVPDVIITGVQQDALGDYELNYIPFADLGGNDCRWFDATSVSVSNEIDIFTGFDPLADCNRGKLGVGTNLMRVAKIEGHNFTDRDSIFVGIYGRTFIDNQIYPPGTPGLDRRYTGIFGECAGLSQQTIGLTSFGVRGKSDVGKYVIGVYGEAFQDVNTSTTHTMGVRAEATHSDTYNAINVALYAEVKPDPITLNSGASNRALITVGASTSIGPQIIISDENVKTDIATLENAAEILQQINPVTYVFESPENRKLPFSQNLQYGLIAQDVQEVMPEVVYLNTIPEAMDSLGIIEGSGLELLGIDYNSFIPILIQGFKEQSELVSEQQGLIQEQNDMIESLEETIVEQATQMEALQTQMQDVLTQVQNMEITTSNCCTQKSGTGSQSPRGDDGSQEMKLGQNVPNPFTDVTRIDFELPFDAQVILEITDGTGRPIQTLIDGQMSSGVHTTTWDGSGVAPGMYYYTLYANGELLSKKMIKR